MSNLWITRQSKNEELFNFLCQCKGISYPCLFIKDKTERAIIVLIFNIFFSPDETSAQSILPFM